MSLLEKGLIAASMIGVTGMGVYFVAKNTMSGSKDKSKYLLFLFIHVILR